MIEIYKLQNQIKHYDWGSPKLIPGFLGCENPDGLPFAEMWMGTHPAAPSLVEEEDPPRRTRREDTELHRGRRGGVVPLLDLLPNGGLPFLFKALGIEKPLSLQAHPNSEQAAAGFKRENAAGLALDDPSRSFRDENDKAEILCAITPMTVMVGFREPENRLEPFQLELMQRLSRQYPNDAAAFAPLYLNVFTLKPFQAIYIPSCVLHSYVSGFGVELMTNSDNVLRGGLTPKHVDIGELMNILDFKPFMPNIITPPDEPVFNYPSHCGLSLSLLRSTGEKKIYHGGHGGKNTEGTEEEEKYNSSSSFLCLVVSGEVECEGKKFVKGESFIVLHEGNEPISFCGDFTLFTAGQA